MPEQNKHYNFFQNKECEYFPCHKGVKEEDFNCLFCYCPLYTLGKHCGGNCTYTESGIKSCQHCTFPHQKKNYDAIIALPRNCRRRRALGQGGQMNAQEQAQFRWNHVAKPLNSLGKLEQLVVQIAGIQQTAGVCINKRCVLICCGDHGVVAEGVSQSGSEVTALVAQSIVAGTANINLMASVSGTDVYALDFGMVTPVMGTVDCRIAAGTRNMAREPAMTRAQAEQAVQAGIDAVARMKARGYQLIATGEMGIGNTTASTAMACALLCCSPEDITGRGAGLSDAGLQRKKAAIQRALSIHHPNADDALDVLAKVGGFEIAGMVGIFLGGLRHHVPIVIDGVISAVAALTAVRIDPASKSAMLPSHMSHEPAVVRIMSELGMSPIIYADMALGEGTGAVSLIPLLDMALKVYHGPHTFDELGISAYEPQEGKA